MPHPPSKRSIRIQQDRVRSADLLKVYGCLLTPKRYSMTAAYCLEGKSFSQIAREHDVSRQAVHEAVRSVQRALKTFEEKLGLLENPAAAAGIGAGTGPGGAVLNEAVDRLTALKSKINRRGGSTSSPEWIVQELDETIRVLEEEAEYTTRKPEKAR